MYFSPTRYLNYAGAALFWLTLIIICLFPLVRLLLQAFSVMVHDGSLSLIGQLGHDKLTLSALYNTVETGLLSTLISVLLGTFFAIVLADPLIRLRRMWIFAIMLPMMIPPQITALSWLQLFGPSSALLQSLNIAPPLGTPQPLYSGAGIALLMGVQHTPLVFLLVKTNLAMLPGYLGEAASLAGASSLHQLKTIVIPLLRSGIIAGASVAFIASVGNFGIPAMLGIPVGYYVLPTLIYQKMAGFGEQMLAQIALLSLIIILLTLVVSWNQKRLQKRYSYPLISTSGASLVIILPRCWRRLFTTLMGLLLMLMLVAPLLALITSSLVPSIGIPLNQESLTFRAYHEMLFNQPATFRAFKNSLLLTLSCVMVLMSITIPIVWLSSRRPNRLLSGLTSLLELPYAIPGTVLAVACILLWAPPLPLLNYSLLGTLLILFLAYLARFLVIALKPVQAHYQQLDSALIEAARLAGANSYQCATQIVTPLLLSAVCAGGLLVFLTAFNELTVSALLWSAGNETLGVLIYNFNDSGDIVLASAISVILVLFILFIMLLTTLFANYLPKGTIPWLS